MYVSVCTFIWLLVHLFTGSSCPLIWLLRVILFIIYCHPVLTLALTVALAPITVALFFSSVKYDTWDIKHFLSDIGDIWHSNNMWLGHTNIWLGDSTTFEVIFDLVSQLLIAFFLYLVYYSLLISFKVVNNAKTKTCFFCSCEVFH